MVQLANAKKSRTGVFTGAKQCSCDYGKCCYDEPHDAEEHGMNLEPRYTARTRRKNKNEVDIPLKAAHVPSNATSGVQYPVVTTACRSDGMHTLKERECTYQDRDQQQTDRCGDAGLCC